MTSRPLHPCADCPTLVAKGRSRCDAHERQRHRAYNGRRPAIHAFYRSPEWRRLRQEVDAEGAKYCAICGRSDGRLDLDHIKTLVERPDLALARSNVRWLCVSCHSKKTVVGR